MEWLGVEGCQMSVGHKLLERQAHSDEPRLTGIGISLCRFDLAQAPKQVHRATVQLGRIP